MRMLNLFYEEAPITDRWFPTDRYSRRIARRILRGKAQPGGQMRVFLNLRAGLDRIKVPYRVNDYKFAAGNTSEVVGIIGKPHLLKKVEWQNPHTFFYIDVKDDKTGQVANWSIELGSPNSLMRLGWTRNSMKLEDMVTVQGSLAKDGSKLVNARNVTLAGTTQKLLTGSSEGDGK